MQYSSGEIVWRLIAVLALVFANGFFVAAEFAIVTVRKTRVDQLIAEGNWRAHAVRREGNIVWLAPARAREASIGSTTR